MFNRILVPLDGSPLAEQALPHAIVLARRAKAELLLTRAVQAGGGLGRDWVHAQKKATEEADEYLGGLRDRLLADGLTAETATPYGTADLAIVDEVHVRHVDLVVMATHGRSGLSRLVYGSVAESVLANSPVPVLLVPARSEANGTQQAPLGTGARILLALDGSSFAEEAMPVAEAVAGLLQGSIALTCSVHAPPAAVTAEGRVIGYAEVASEWEMGVQGRNALREASQRELMESVQDAEQYLLDAAKQLGGDVPTDVRVGPPAEAIAAAAREHQSDLVIMATHGRSGLGKLVFGSVASGVIQSGSVPVLLVKPQGLRQFLSVVSAHSAAESSSIESYRQLANTAEDPVVRLLLGMVLQDEERHHTLLTSIAASARDELHWTHSDEALPAGPARSTAAATQTIAALRPLIEHERHGADELRRLAEQQRHLHDGLYSALLEVMALDSEKHARILGYALDRLVASR
jgi:nucleotide-binding universal stress UspA family protein/rubrerythrin